MQFITKLLALFVRNKLLLTILFIGFAVRIWGIWFGLPQKQIIDEATTVYWAFYSGAHWLRSNWYLYAPLAPTLYLIELSVIFVMGKLFGVFSVPFDLLVAYLKDPTFFFLFGRLNSAISGTLTVWVVYRIGTLLKNKYVGFIAAFFLALTFLHVKESHYIKEDVLSTFFLSCSFFWVIKQFSDKNIRVFILMGLFFGLAVGAKYQTALFGIVLIVAHYWSTGKIVTRKLIIVLTSGLVSFLIVHPYFLFDFRHTFLGTLRDAMLGQVVYPEHLQGKPVWWWFLSVHIPQGLGVPLFLASVLGFFTCFKIGKSDRRYWLVPLLPVVFLITVDIWSKYHNARYAVMTIPFFCLAAALFISESIQFRKKKFLTFGVCLFIILISLIRIIKFNRLITQSDTRLQSSAWIEATIPQKSTILIESMLRPEYPSHLNTPLHIDGESINERIAETEKRGLEAAYLNALKIANQTKIGFHLMASSRFDYTYDPFTSAMHQLYSVEEYLQENVEYLITTSWQKRPDISSQFLESLSTKYELIKEFHPTYTFSEDPHFLRLDYPILDTVDVFRNDLVAGPVIKIYKLRL